MPVEDEVILGRSATGTVMVDDPELSRRHARVYRDGDQLLIEDLGSSNGTYVNDARITGAQALQPGDTVTIGTTHIEVRLGLLPTQSIAVPGLAQQQGAGGVAAPPAPEAPLPPGAPLPPAASQPGAVPQQYTPGAPPPGSPDYLTGAVGGAGRSKAPLVLLLVLILVVALGFGGWFAFVRDTGASSNAGADVADDCGRNLGGGQPVAMVAYVQSNTTKDNGVLAIPYRAGDMAPLPISRCATGGTGSADLTDSGVLDANNQILINPVHTLLFSVNQGSDSIAVFTIAANGALTPVAGSPFPSGGKAPASLGLVRNTLVVANKAQDGIRDLTTEKPTYTTFRMESDGRLTPVPNSTVESEPGASPTDAYVPPNGTVAFSTEESGPLRSFAVDDNGVLKQSDDSPKQIDGDVFPDGFDEKKKFALGVVAHPARKLLYISMPTVPALAVYSYDEDNGNLDFENVVPNGGSYLPCWNVVTPDGRFLYTTNADTNNVTVYDLDDAKDPKQIQTFTFDQAGNPWNAAVDRDGRFLTVIAPRDTPKVPEGEGNIVHLLRIGEDGKLTEVGPPAKLPVPAGTNPQGLAVLNLG